jgi:hypothetical protein
MNTDQNTPPQPTTPLVSSRRSINIVSSTPTTGKPAPNELIHSKQKLSSHKAQVIANQIHHIKLPAHKLKLNNYNQNDHEQRLGSFSQPYSSFQIDTFNQSFAAEENRTSLITPRNSSSTLAPTPTLTPIKRGVGGGSGNGNHNNSFLFDPGSPPTPMATHQHGSHSAENPAFIPKGTNRNSIGGNSSLTPLSCPQNFSFIEPRKSSQSTSFSIGPPSSFGGGLHSEKSNLMQYTNMIRSTSLLKQNNASKLSQMDLNNIDQFGTIMEHYPIISPTNTNYSNDDNFDDSFHYSGTNNPHNTQQKQPQVYKNPHTTLPLEETSFATPASQLLGEIDLPLYYLAPGYDIFPTTRQKLEFYAETHQITQQTLSNKNQQLLLSKQPNHFGEDKFNGVGLSSVASAPISPTNELVLPEFYQQQAKTLSIQYEKEHATKTAEIEALVYVLDEIKSKNGGKIPKMYKDEHKLLEKLTDELKKLEKKHQKEMKRTIEQNEKQYQNDLRRQNGRGSITTGPLTFLQKTLSSAKDKDQNYTNQNNTIKLTTPTNQSNLLNPPSTKLSTTQSTDELGNKPTKRKSSLFRFSKVTQSPTLTDTSNATTGITIHTGNTSTVSVNNTNGNMNGNNKQAPKSKINAFFGFADPNAKTNGKLITAPVSTTFSPRTTTAAQTVASSATLDTLLFFNVTKRMQLGKPIILERRDIIICIIYRFM